MTAQVPPVPAAAAPLAVGMNDWKPCEPGNPPATRRTWRARKAAEAVSHWLRQAVAVLLPHALDGLVGHACVLARSLTRFRPQPPPSAGSARTAFGVRRGG